MSGMVFYKERMVARLMKEGRVDLLLGNPEAVAVANDLDGQPVDSNCWERVVNGKPVLWCVGKSGKGQYVNENDCAVAR